MGILDQQGTPAQSAPPPAGGEAAPAAPPGPEQDPAAQGGNKPSAAEQEQYDKIVSAAAEMLYDKKSGDQVMEILKAGAQDPVKAVVEVYKMIASQIDSMLGGMPVPLILPTAFMILEMIGELASKAGLFEYGEAEHTEAVKQVVTEEAQKQGATPEQIQGFIDKMGGGAAPGAAPAPEQPMMGQEA